MVNFICEEFDIVPRESAPAAAPIPDFCCNFLLTLFNRLLFIVTPVLFLSTIGFMAIPSGVGGQHVKCLLRSLLPFTGSIIYLQHLDVFLKFFVF